MGPRASGERGVHAGHEAARWRRSRHAPTSRRPSGQTDGWIWNALRGPGRRARQEPLQAAAEMQPQVVEVGQAVRARPGTRHLQPAVSESLVTPTSAP
jgi:hypothetical protein